MDRPLTMGNIRPIVSTDPMRNTIIGTIATPSGLTFRYRDRKDMLTSIASKLQNMSFTEVSSMIIANVESSKSNLTQLVRYDILIGRVHTQLQSLSGSTQKEYLSLEKSLKEKRQILVEKILAHN